MNEEMMADLDKVLKRIPDDVVEYYIYPQIPSHICDESDIRIYLEKQLDVILAHASNKLVNYIWQHEPFRLKAVPGKLAWNCKKVKLKGQKNVNNWGSALSSF